MDGGREGGREGWVGERASHAHQYTHTGVQARGDVKHTCSKCVDTHTHTHTHEHLFNVFLGANQKLYISRILLIDREMWREGGREREGGKERGREREGETTANLFQIERER